MCEKSSSLGWGYFQSYIFLELLRTYKDLSDDFMARSGLIFDLAAILFRFLDRRMGFSWMDCALLLLTWNCLRVKWWKIGEDCNGLILMKPIILLLAWWWSRNVKLNEAGEVCELERLIQRLNWTFVFYRHNLTKARHIFKRRKMVKCKDISCCFCCEWIFE